MKNALIGYTGLVGKNILKSKPKIDFDLYNSKNILSLKNRKYDLTIVAAPSAIKWKANKNPIQDLNCILNLLDSLYSFDSKKVILISTIDVYGEQIKDGLDELASLDLERHPYGKNRLIFENYCKNKFDTTVIRLPALFGSFLKKNIIYDLLNDKMLENISLETHYQWLNLDKIGNIIDYSLQTKNSTINYVTEPLSTRTIIENLFPKKVQYCLGKNKNFYNVKTSLHHNGYFEDKKSVYLELEKFIYKEKRC